jgi:hypothetical protein
MLINQVQEVSKEGVHMRFRVLIALTMKITVFWALVKCFGGTFCLHLQGILID